MQSSVNLVVTPLVSLITITWMIIKLNWKVGNWINSIEQLKVARHAVVTMVDEEVILVCEADYFHYFTLP